MPDKTYDYFLENDILKYLSHRNNHAVRDDYLEQVVIPKKLIPYILEGFETVYFAFFLIIEPSEKNSIGKNVS